jgi:shikimate kinase
MLIYLIGFMGSGKTTTGKKLAAFLNYRIVDLDEYIEEKFRITIPDIFNRFDEIAFRKIERDELLETTALKNTVVSTGGGTPCFFDNMEIINKHGTSVYLKLHPKSIFSRLNESKKRRPLMENKTDLEKYDFIVSKLADREKFYVQAHHTIKAENLILSELVKLL